MRCPKCGYISFDHVDECLKCKKNIKSASEVLQGSVANVSPPSFLKFGADAKEADEVETDFSDDFSPMESTIAEDDSDLVSGEINFSADEPEEIELATDSLPEESFEDEVVAAGLETEEEDGDIEVDLSQFEEVSDPEAAFLSDDSDVSLDDDDGDVMEISVPDELADMSDLAPPEPEPVAVAEVAIEEPDLEIDAGPVDLDLEDLNFDLALDDVAEKEDVATEPIQETVLALDDIDFSDALSGDIETKEEKPASMDMDSDLDFDLDLGGLSIHKDV